ncbi:unnamed protein product, partial [Brassica rapa subsp. narinosa]
MRQQLLHRLKKTFHQYLHAYSGPKATPNVVGRICLIQGSDIYITRTQIQRSSLHCVY